ncbi:MAG: type IX secretion system membrane protein PorP/SprF [Bacteroidales bacterium]
MKRVGTLLGILFCAALPRLMGQQMPQYTQYMFNDFVINPAIAGVHDFYQIRTNHRFQWVGLVDPPLTNSIAFYGPHAKLDMGYGGYVYNDVTGPTSRTGITGSYAYNIAVATDIRLSMGLSASFMQFRIDGTQLSPEDVSDPALLQMVSTSYLPDAGIGFYLYSEDFYAGLSVAQLLNNSLKIFDDKNGLNRLKTHINLTGAYRYHINDDWMVEPSVMIKGTAPKELSFDLTARAEWQRMFWGALAYRLKESVGVLIGYNYEDTLLFGYSYDIGISSLRKYNSGTHEIMIGYRFNEIK